MIYGKDKEAPSSGFIYSNLFNSIKDFAFILTDCTGNILNWNKGAEKIFLYTEEEVKGKNLSIIYKNTDHSSLEKELKVAIEEREYTFETIRVTKNNAPFIAEITIVPIVEEENKIFGFSFQIKDLSQLKLSGIPGYKLPEKLLNLNRDLEEEIDLRIKIERALRDKEKEQLDLLEHAPMGIVWTTSADEIKMVNRTLLDLWKYEKEDLANKNISSLFYRSDEAEMLLADVKKGHVVSNYRTVFLNKTGECRNVSLNTSAYSKDDHLVHTRWYIEDITDKVIGEKAIAEKERLGRILDDSSNEIYIFDSGSLKFQHVNRGALLNLGYTSEEIRNFTPLDLKPEFTLQSFKELVKPLLNGEKQVIFFETVHKRKNQSLYDVEVRLQLNKSEEYPVFVAMIMDITERKAVQKKLEEMLRENKIARAKAESAANKFILLARCNEILNSSMDFKTTLRNVTKILIPSLADWIAIDLIDEQQNIYRELLQHADETKKAAAKKMLKYIPDKGSKAGAADVIATGKPKIYEKIDRKLINKNATSEEHKNLALELGLNSSLIIPLKIRNNILGALTLVYSKKQYTAEDLALAEEIAHRMAVAIENSRLFSQVQTLNKQLIKRADELTSSNSELERFAYVASHDLQEPLRVITSFLQLLDKKYGNNLDEKARSYINYAVDGSIRMRQLIRDLLNYSRLDSGKNIRTEVDLNLVMQEVVNNLAASMAHNNADINMEVLPVVKANKAQMVQLFQNLISNSLKYRKKEEDPRIKITCQRKTRYVVISVADNGIGISPNYHQRIFEMFQRLHTREEYSGTGIGLAICKKIMEHHNGFIELNSEEGMGTEFILNIPTGKL